MRGALWACHRPYKISKTTLVPQEGSLKAVIGQRCGFLAQFWLVRQAVAGFWPEKLERSAHGEVSNR